MPLAPGAVGGGAGYKWKLDMRCIETDLPDQFRIGFPIQRIFGKPRCHAPRPQITLGLLDQCQHELRHGARIGGQPVLRQVRTSPNSPAAVRDQRFPGSKSDAGDPVGKGNREQIQGANHIRPKLLDGMEPMHVHSATGRSRARCSVRARMVSTHLPACVISAEPG